jgi:hypothetical protein
MSEHSGVDWLCLPDFLAKRRVAIDAVDPEGARVVKRHEKVFGGYVGRKMNGSGWKQYGVAVLRELACGIYAKRGYMMCVS